MIDIDVFYISTLEDSTSKPLRFLRHMKNSPGLCTACGKDCSDCRSKTVSDFSSNIIEHLRLPSFKGHFIDDPGEVLPDKLASHDIAMVVGVHNDLLLELPELIAKADGKALIVPVEDPDWLDEWTKRELENRCEKLGLEFAAPKPFCSLTGEGSVFIKRFVEEFKMGRPQIRMELIGDVVDKVDVVVSAPCGATYYIARLLKGLSVSEEQIQTACKGLSSYPCTASTKIDPQFKDSITHKANYIMMDVVRESYLTAKNG